MEHALEIRGLCKSYKSFLLRNASFRVPTGSIMGLIGPNGAGKTTIIKIIMNLVRSDAGEVLLFGLNHVRHEAEVKARIGFVYDVPVFYEDAALMTIKSAIASFYTTWNEDLFRSLMVEFQLPEKLQFRKLSQGMKTKFALALALSHDADFILMDEPTTGLDPVFRRELLHKLAEIMQSEQKSVLFSTHITSDLERTADYITFLNRGEVVFSEPKDKVLENWGVVRGGKEVLTEDDRSLLAGIQLREHSFEGLSMDVREARRQFAGRAIVEKPTLDEIMILLRKGGTP